MPERSDINPAEISDLLPYLIIVDRTKGRLRYRLIGSAVAEQMGYDSTDKYVGYYGSKPEVLAQVRAMYETVFGTGQPALAAYQQMSGGSNFHCISQLMLPLTNGAADLNMVLCIRIARFNAMARLDAEWIKSGNVHICRVVSVGDAQELRQYCQDWELGCGWCPRAP